ncbi:hypothetical protein C8J57DRAFT_1541139 [Mycena rebaudengoi]|nr:hypothetical protein C8J57DRAFT_1541139 [Mycena rebaudengoi]
MSTPIPTPPVLSNRALHNKLVSELHSIAAAMGLDETLYKDPLLHFIEQHMQAKPKIADDPCFLPLFAHRTPAKAVRKTSAGKDTEEEADASKPMQAATGDTPSIIAALKHAILRFL